MLATSSLRAGAVAQPPKAVHRAQAAPQRRRRVVARDAAAAAAAAKEAALKELEAFSAQNKQRISAAAEKLASGGAAKPAAAGAAAAAGEPAAAQGGLLELFQENFWEHLEQNADKLVVVDFFTEWCGPCKLILPQLVELNAELQAKGVQIVKVNCSARNKDLGKQVAVKVAPTFHLYRGREKVGEVVGANINALKALIDANLPA